jgi:hypothetical protein
MRLTRLLLVDLFGRKRVLGFDGAPACSAPFLAIDRTGLPVPGTAYLAPRLAQPSRLVLRWLAADKSGLDEMNAVPAATPVCGWLLPNRVDRSLLLFSGEGRALGSIGLYGTFAARPVGWRPPPGEDAGSYLPARANDQLHGFADSLIFGSADRFEALWDVLDAASDTVDPGTPSSNTGMPALVSRPIALAQALLRVEVLGTPVLDLGWDALKADTDEGTSGLALPVVLGHPERLGDGLMGWFAARPGDPRGIYDWSTFYSHAAPQRGRQHGVVRPMLESLTLTPAPEPSTTEPVDMSADTRTVMLLLDPLVPVHATTGILPTGALQLPPDRVGDALGRLSFALFAAPVLSGSDDPAAVGLPAPAQPGYQVSWSQHRTGDEAWETRTLQPPGEGVFAYTPQRLLEGWLRFDPLILQFVLLGVDDQPVITPGPGRELGVRLVNLGRLPVTFAAGAEGSTIAIGLADLVEPQHVPAATLTAPNWSFALVEQAGQAPLWVARPDSSLALEPGSHLTLSLANLSVRSGDTRRTITFDYAAIAGIQDGRASEAIAVKSVAAQRSS